MQAPSIKSVDPKFVLTRILLRLWDKYDRGQPCTTEAMLFVQIDSARETYSGVPSVVA